MFCTLMLCKGRGIGEDSTTFWFRACMEMMLGGRHRESGCHIDIIHERKGIITKFREGFIKIGLKSFSDGDVGLHMSI